MSIHFYEDKNGRTPVEEFLASLPLKEEVKMHWTIDLLEECGAHLKEPYAKHISGRIWELRTRENRIFYFFDKDRFVLLHGYRKKTQKMPTSEFVIAMKRMNDYLERRDRRC